MLIITYEGISVNVNRPEAPTKTFSFDDVPHGEDSVYVKAAQILNSCHGKNISIPRFTLSEIDGMIGNKKSSIVAVISATDLDSQVSIPLQSEIDIEFAKRNHAGKNVYSNKVDAKNALIEIRKTELANRYVNNRISQFFDVPNLSDEWKAQFTAREI